MAHFAELDNNNKVIRVIVVDNTDLLNASGEESEALGIAFCENLLGGRWVQTSYNANFRKHYAAPDFTYSEELDAFVPPKPYDSWVLNENEVVWEAPISYPADGKAYVWDEDVQNWSEVEFK